MEISKDMKWIVDCNDPNVIAKEFADFWNRHVSNDKLILKEVFKGFDINEKVIDTEGVEGDEHHRVKILFTRPSTGDLQVNVIVKIFYASPWSIYWEKVPAVPESELVNIFEEFRRITESNRPKSGESEPKYEAKPKPDLKSKNPTVMKRRRKLLEMWPSIVENDTTDVWLAQHFGVSEETVRKDRHALRLLKR